MWNKKCLGFALPKNTTLESKLYHSILPWSPGQKPRQGDLLISARTRRQRNRRSPWRQSWVSARGAVAQGGRQPADNRWCGRPNGNMRGRRSASEALASCRLNENNIDVREKKLFSFNWIQRVWRRENNPR